MFHPSVTEYWLLYADNSYISSRLLHFSALQVDSSVEGHRSIELYLKAFAHSRGHQIKMNSPFWGHDIASLYKSCVDKSSLNCNRALEDRIAYFQRYFELLRYPTELEKARSGNWYIWISGGPQVFNILDEIVAFIRPRLSLSAAAWESSVVHRVRGNDRTYRRRAISDSNPHLDTIDCLATHESVVEFDDALFAAARDC